MRMRLLFMWITFTALLQWSHAEEDNIHELSVVGGDGGVDDKEDGDPAVVQEVSFPPPDETASMTTTEMPEKIPVVTHGPSEMSSTMDQHSEENKPEPTETPMDPANPQSGEDLKEPSKTSEPPIEIPESSKEKNPTTDPAPPEESSSEVGKDASEEPQPQTSPGKMPEFENPKTSSDGADYPNDAPQDITTTMPSTLTTVRPPLPSPVPPKVPPPVFMNISCYSCMFCDGPVNNKTKTLCPPEKNKWNGCFTVFVRDAKMAPGKDKYLVRGCIGDLDANLLDYCGKNAELCSKCYDHYCNSQDISTYEAATAGSGHQIAYLSITLIFGSFGWNWINYQMLL
ncbi:hypothetical protein KR067_008020 [Drosophila pandora]|nr:hypothetical protein KR067_008020 [Drosophila pandora]